MTREDWLRCWGFVDGTPEADAAWAEKQAMTVRTSHLTLIPDISPFKSPVDGTVVGSRRTLRDHNARHDVVQLGNDRIKRQENAPMARAGHDIVRALHTARG